MLSLALLGPFATLADAAFAGPADRALPDEAAPALAGSIRVWGQGGAGGFDRLVEAVASAFRRHRPGIVIETVLCGNAAAIGGLYTGAADIALMDRAPLDIELDGYSIMKRPLCGVTFAVGGLHGRSHAAAPMVLVHRTNPLSSLTLAQLDAIIGADRRRGSPRIERWDELDATRGWSGAPIEVHVPSLGGDSAGFIEAVVMSGSRKWTAALNEYADRIGADGRPLTAGRQIVAALAKDRHGIGFATFADLDRNVAPLALSAGGREPAVPATRANLIARRYPLTRTAWLYANREPGRPLDPKVQAFGRFLLSDEGQRLIAADAGYLPLAPAAARAEAAKLA